MEVSGWQGQRRGGEGREAAGQPCSASALQVLQELGREGFLPPGLQSHKSSFRAPPPTHGLHTLSQRHGVSQWLTNEKQADPAASVPATRSHKGHPKVLVSLAGAQSNLGANLERGFPS